ncbi:hypothetical protein ISN45_Aa06g005830 [Arabidopsis thaliana x Arabidopsis arenosa]|uniref:Uncharacterized protein n=1 Tax=Arabidopsis thaliana x Arabidopsis arenosa TaxID=1240361 RepID=A0A8T1YTE0_9BRAS|nr:hypothetical protein ISN45_Aa06g005830 [Arabidopsis thaliana x Arabidopsis arenosa]
MDRPPSFPHYQIPNPNFFHPVPPPNFFFSPPPAHLQNPNNYSIAADSRALRYRSTHELLPCELELNNNGDGVSLEDLADFGRNCRSWLTCLSSINFNTCCGM